MKYIILVVAAVVFCSLHGALGIMCKECTPNANPVKTCTNPNELVDVDCENVSFPFNVTNGTKYDACAKSIILADLGGAKIQSFVMSCAVKSNSTNPSVVNCSIVEDYVCGDARRRAQSEPYSIDSCSSICCLGNSCNGVDLSPPTQAPDTSTAASTTAGTTAGSGVSKEQPSCLGLPLVLVTMSVILMKKVA